MNRREFVIALGAVGAAGSALTTEPLRKFKVGVLGASHSHGSDKIRLLASHPTFELIGVAEQNEAIRRNFPGLKWLSEEDVLAQSDVIFVESDVRDHGRHALAALRAERHVHVEKPAAATWHEMEEMSKLAGQGSLLLQCGYMWRYNPGFTAIFEAVRSGWLGDVFQLRGAMHNQLRPGLRGEWAEFKGGSFFEQASHLVDPLVRLMGSPIEVKSTLQSHKGDQLKDNNAAVFEFPHALGLLTNSTHQPNAFAHRSFEVLGTNGTMTLKPIEPPTLVVDLAKPAGPYKAGAQTVLLPKYERYVGDIDELAAALSGKTKLTASLEDELLVHQWVLRSSGMWPDQ